MEKIVQLLQRRIWLGPLILILTLLVGLGVGLAIGWMTVEFKPNASDVAAAADSYALNNDLDLAKARLRGLSQAELETIFARLIRDKTAANQTFEAQRLTSLAQALGVKTTSVVVGTPPPTALGTPMPSGTPTPPSAGGLGGLIGNLLPVILLLLVAALILGGGALFLFRILPAWRAARARGIQPSEPAASSLAARARAAVTPPPPPTTAPGGLGRFVPTYNLGNDNYDTSYSLETSRGEFLGECGMGISETIGEGKPDKVTAFDLWLFDKADVRTVTLILMSEYAFNDQALRTKLATKGEAVLAEKGKTLSLETPSLAISAQIVELVYATNPAFPTNSHFQKLIVEIVPTVKEGATR